MFEDDFGLPLPQLFGCDMQLHFDTCAPANRFCCSATINRNFRSLAVLHVHSSRKGSTMENSLGLGKPIPTGIITQTEILSPREISSAESQIGNDEMNAHAQPMLSAAQALTGMMFMPFLAWTSMTASYMRFFQLTDDNAGSA